MGLGKRPAAHHTSMNAGARRTRSTRTGQAPRTARGTAGEAARSARGTADEAASSKTLDRLTRFGLVTYGVMHALVAWLAVQIAWGHAPAEGDQSGAFQTL